MIRGRADKRAKVSPYVPRYTRELVHQVAHYLRCPEGEAARRVTLAALDDAPTLNRLAPYFWRSFAKWETLWPGHKDRADIRKLVDDPGDVTERMHVRYSQDEWSALYDLAFAIGDGGVAKAVAALLVLAVRDYRLLQKAAPGFVPRSPYSLKEGSPLWASGQTRS